MIEGLGASLRAEREARDAVPVAWGGGASGGGGGTRRSPPRGGAADRVESAGQRRARLLASLVSGGRSGGAAAPAGDPATGSDDDYDAGSTPAGSSASDDDGAVEAVAARAAAPRVSTSDAAVPQAAGGVPVAARLRPASAMARAGPAVARLRDVGGLADGTGGPAVAGSQTAREAAHDAATAAIAVVRARSAGALARLERALAAPRIVSRARTPLCPPSAAAKPRRRPSAVSVVSSVVCWRRRACAKFCMTSSCGCAGERCDEARSAFRRIHRRGREPLLVDVGGTRRVRSADIRPWLCHGVRGGGGHVQGPWWDGRHRRIHQLARVQRQRPGLHHTVDVPPL